MKFKLLIISLILILISLVAVQPRIYAADNPGQLLNKACQTANANPTCNQAAKQTENPNKNPVTKTIGKVANLLAMVAGILAVAMIIISGFMFVTAANDANKVKTARSTLMYSVIGLVVVALSWSIVRFITDKIIQ